MAWINHQSQSIEHELSLLINSKTFSYADEVTIPANSTLSLNFKTGAKDVLIQFVEVTGLLTACKVAGYASATLSNNGTLITGKTANMRNKGSDTVQPLSTLYAAPTITNVGTQMSLDVAIGSAQGSNVNPAHGGTSGQFILGRNTNNLFQITNRDTNTATTAAIKMRWVEDEI